MYALFLKSVADPEPDGLPIPVAKSESDEALKTLIRENRTETYLEDGYRRYFKQDSILFDYVVPEYNGVNEFGSYEGVVEISCQAPKFRTIADSLEKYFNDTFGPLPTV